jgi:2-succinyl-5-enolpyruvyl-6-hydroxy-3-cyclohexene-1-carboxylate synthase
VNPSTAFGTVLADELARCGLGEVVIAPGSRSTPLAIAFWELDRAGRVRLHVRIDERSAAYTALGLAKASGRPVAVVCTSGTAAANFHPAVIEADESAVPLLVLTADRPPELRDTGASQSVDQVKLYGSAVRWYAEAGVPEMRAGAGGYWRSLACRAWAQAAGTAGTLPGPVHLNLPFRDPLVPDSPVSPDFPPEAALVAASKGAAGSGAMGSADWSQALAGRPGGQPWTRVAARAPRAATLELPWRERGLVVCGDGDYDNAALTELAELAGWPVLAEPSSGARRGPAALTGYQYLLASPVFMAAHPPDVIISAGRPGLTRPQAALLGLALRAAPARRPVRHVVLTQGPGNWADQRHAATDVAAGVRLSGVPPRVPSRWLGNGRRRTRRRPPRPRLSCPRALPPPRRAGPARRPRASANRESPGNWPPRCRRTACSGAGTRCPCGTSTCSCRRAPTSACWRAGGPAASTEPRRPRSAPRSRTPASIRARRGSR